ncbi:MAG: UPF0182 family protein [Cyanothece sp. SIO1E1]|nr:UPF0182 family protein [Cyanothece sp. SIO1E1]
MFSIKRSPPPHKNTHHLRWAVLLIGVVLLLDFAAHLVAESFWFQEVGYLQAFRLQIQTRLSLSLLVCGASLGVLLGSLALARQCEYPAPAGTPASGMGPQIVRIPPKPSAPALRLRWLLPLSLGLGILMGVMLLYQFDIAIRYWHPRLSLYSDAPPFPLQFRLAAVWEIAQQLMANPWQLGLVFGIAIALLIYPQILVIVAAIFMSLGFGLVLSEQWPKVLLALNAVKFDQVDPLFGRDISFYIFTLPVLQLLKFWLIGLFSYALVSATLVYLLACNNLSQGYFPGFTRSQKRHLNFLGSGLMLAVGLGYWLARYELLYSPRGVAYGASYTDVTAQLPIDTGLSVLALLMAVSLLWRALFWHLPLKGLNLGGIKMGPKKHFEAAKPSLQMGKPQLLLYSLGLYLLLVAITGFIVPLAVQRLIVQPNELARERPYMQRTIALTRKAFDLENIEVETFDPDTNLTFADLKQNDLTVRNVRLWDTRPLLETNRQLQQIRLYYEFADADVDRYTMRTEAGGTERQQVLIAARELNYERVPAEAKTWVNEHLIYTHGYGFTLSPVNKADPSGLPDYFIQDIGHVASSEHIRDSIPVGQPRIYYGELTNTYVMTQTQVRELDYPSGSDNVYNTYSGQGGVAIGQFWQRLLFARYLRDWRMLLTNDFTPQTRLLFRREINQRVRAIAPFLQYDSDPYLVVADAGQTGLDDAAAQGAQANVQSSDLSPDKNYLYWIIDAYTTSDRYPYSDPNGNDFNYIRNSVKVVVDAYNGSVSFYIADPQDPVINNWSQIFPGMFQPLRAMPETLRTHIRYPEDFYRVQSNQLMIYHMTDPQVFYNREDLWRAPSEIYADESQLVEPYYLIMKLPAETAEEFTLLRPFTPAQRNNLVAWLAARSDGDRYGRMLLYRFPKQELVFGPEQIEARINQEPAISQRISLWNRQGSRAIQGNLLVIPIEQSLLYVEPLYLEAEQNRLPTLARVIVAYGNRIAMAKTLDQALMAIFQPLTPEASTIIRELNEDILLEGELPPESLEAAEVRELLEP